jgi:hypothetical protein
VEFCYHACGNSAARFKRMWPHESRVLVCLLCVLALGAWHDATILMRYPVAVGIDGYYYVLQVNGLCEHGRLQFPTNTPLVFYFLAALRFISGDTVFAIKSGALILQALLCAGIFSVVRGATRSAWLGLLGSVLVSISALRLFMIAEYIKNLEAAALLTWCGWSIIRAAQTRRRIYVVSAVVLLVAAALSHRSALPVASAVAACALLWRMIIVPYRGKTYARLALPICLLLWLSPAIVAAQAFVALPPGLERELSPTPQWPLRLVAFGEGLLLLLISAATLAICAIRRTTSSLGIPEQVFGAVALFGLLVILNPFLVSANGWIGYAGRLGGLAYIQNSILLPGLLWQVMLARRDTLLYAVAVVSPLVILNARAASPAWLQDAPLAQRAVLIEELQANRGRLSPTSIVIAPHGDEFVLRHVLGVASQQRPPARAEGYTVFWEFNRVERSDLIPSMIVLPTGSDNVFNVIIEDGDSRRWVASLPDDRRRRLLTANPHYLAAYRSLD